MVLKLRLDTETADRLMDRAIREWRPVDSQAIVLLRESLGLPVPQLPVTARPGGAAHEVVRV